MSLLCCFVFPFSLTFASHNTQNHSVAVLCVHRWKAARAAAATTTSGELRKPLVATLKLFNTSENSSYTLVSSLAKQRSLALKFSSPPPPPVYFFFNHMDFFLSNPLICFFFFLGFASSGQEDCCCMVHQALER